MLTWRSAETNVDLPLLGRRFEAFLSRLADNPDQKAGELHQLMPDEVVVLDEWSHGPRSTARIDATIHAQFDASARRAPDAIALIFEDDSITFAELEGQASRLARELVSAGVQPGQPVGICLHRSIELVTAVLGVLKAGGAYVPLDPAYPPNRLAFMIADSGMSVAITQPSCAHLIPPGVSAISMARNRPVLAAEDRAVSPSPARPEDLAYLIYTSGSTGQPKGVMVEHRNVVSFFTGMDAMLGGAEPGVWLAATSLSFDISVLELLWTLTRGYRVVIQGDDQRPTALARSASMPGGMDFSLFYFSASGDADAPGKRDKYRLLLEGARFADTHDFVAIWTPERHFHAFGGLYPNPSVTGAAVAAITQRVAIRAGSCVLPLHHPVRVAEEWSVVDNLSNGRVGLSVAAGWQPDDFVLRPETYQDAKAAMLRELEIVRRLWRGETIEMRGPKGDVMVRCMPRPVQPELPIWITTAGNVETFQAAGSAGANVLTHLLGQSVEEIRAKIAAYRAARKEAGHAGSGQVTLMLHTFVGESVDEVKEIVRAPMKAYLKTSISLIRNFAAAFPTFKRKDEQLDFNALSDDQFESLLDYSFERYFESSGLFGDVDCLGMVSKLQEIGVDEIACLVDFGVDADTTLAHLHDLDRLRQAVSSQHGGPDHSVAGLIRRHGVTHFQCTPAMATMLTATEETRAALGSLRVMLLGGEALPEPLARDLRRIVPGRLFNMYGPTETTIWSTYAELVDGPGDISIGRPIVDTDVFVLDKALHPVPPGMEGELCIGGAGVSRGYWQRPELTLERFVQNPLHPESRLYRTGDKVRFAADGTLRFLGRLDNQVKIRGHRIELGEVEAALGAHDGVREVAAVLNGHDAADVRIVAYVCMRNGESPDSLRAWLKDKLPEFMIPARIIGLPELPRTPNQKIDRKTLATRTDLQTAATMPMQQTPASELEQSIAAIWQRVLRVDRVGLDDSFFDLGGHSLLAVQVHGQLQESYRQDLSITDLFRFPTVRKLSAFIAREPSDPTPRRTDRGAVRRAALRGLRARPGTNERSAQ